MAATNAFSSQASTTRLNPARLRTEMQPLVWLVVGLLASYFYTETFTGLFSLTLPLPLFVPQAIILAVLLLTPGHVWLPALIVYYAVQVAEGIRGGGLSPVYALTSNMANLVEPFVGAWLFRRFVPHQREQLYLREVSIYIACVTFASIVGATIGAATRLERGFDFWQSWPLWFLADVLASLVLTPTIIAWSKGWQDVRTAPRGRRVEGAILGVALVSLCWFVFAVQSPNPDYAPALLYLPVPFLVWAAVRFGPRGYLTALTGLTVMAIATSANGFGPFEGRSTGANVFSLQLFLLGVGMPLLLLAVLTRERSQTVAQLRLSEERYRVIVRSLPRGAVFVFGPDLRHQFADGQGLIDLGLSKQAVEGRDLHEVFPADLAAALEPHYRSALHGQQTAFELSHAGRQYELDVFPILGTSIESGMLVVHDVTDHKRAEALAELDRAKTTFISNVSHELRTPLTLLLGPLEDALPIGMLAGDMLKMAHRNVVRLQHLIDDLLEFSRIEAGRVHASFEKTDLSVMTADLASNFRSAIERSGLQLVLDTPPLPADMPVYVDRRMWERVVLNLLSNAFNHTFEGHIGVSLRPSADGNYVRLRISDTGVGIPEREQRRIFDRFRQVPGARSRTSSGSGIGLALVQELVNLQGGTVAVESAEGRGTTFTVSLPVGTAHIPTGAIVVNNTPGLSGERLPGDLSRLLPEFDDVTPITSQLLQSQQRGRILVADDNQDVRNYVSHILGRRWTVETANNGASALQAMQDNPPDVLLLDVMMPDMNGFEILRVLRADPATSRIPVILVSARAGDEAAVEGLLAGADDYISKPFASAELAARVNTQAVAARARAAAEAALKARDEFVALVVHDLRHPLVGINWHIQVLRRRVQSETPITSEQLEDFVASIEAGGKALSMQIDELNDATRLQAGRPLDLRRRSVDLVELAQSVIQQNHSRSDEGERIQFVTTLSELRGDWDATRLERVVENLLSNAVKYSPDAGDITVQIDRDGDWATLVVADHGIGIPPADLPNIFERYARGSNVAALAAGTGLGLAGVKGIVEQHGGSLSVSSTEGKGSTFTIRLPLLAPAREN